MKNQVLALFALVLGSCTGRPEGVAPIQNFELNSYLGTWYEIGRLDHSFERALEQVRAEYNLLPSGQIQVLNQGYNPQKEKWQKALGKARSHGDPREGHLEVSFFGPFYSSYIIFEMGDLGSPYAMISGANKNYLWLLSRTPQVSEATWQRFMSQAQIKGFDTAEIIRVKQNLN